MDIRLILGNNTRRYRLARELSQEALAEKIGADRAYVSAIERGLQNMTIVRVSELAIALDVAFVELFVTPKSSEDGQRKGPAR